jgi:hypothetical protein
VNCSNANYTAHLKKVNCILQSQIAISEQGADFPLTEKSLDFASTLLGFKKGMYLVEGPKQQWSVQPQGLQVMSITP